MHSQKTRTEPTETRQVSDVQAVEIVQLTCKADLRFVDALADSILNYALTCGLGEDEAKHMGVALRVVCRQCIEYGYENEAVQSLQCRLFRRAHCLVVAIDDQGLPFHYQRLQQDPQFACLLSQTGAGQFRFRSLGRAGNQIELSYPLPEGDIPVTQPSTAHAEVSATPEVDTEDLLPVRMMEPDEAVELARAVYRSYGYSYESPFVYEPQQVATQLRDGTLRSCVVYNTSGEMVGHFGLHMERPDLRVAEAGLAVVHPRYRGRGLFKKMKLYMQNYAASQQFIGLYSEAVAVHPYSQLGNLALGAHEIGYLLGGSPQTVAYRGIAGQPHARRQSLALMYLSVLNSPPQTVYPPVDYRPIIQQVYEVNGLERSIHEQDQPVVLPATGRLSIHVHPDTKRVFLAVQAYGQDTFAAVRSQLRQLCLQRLDCVYLDLPLSRPATAVFAKDCRALGFFLGGIIPELMDGDVLRLQYLNNVEISSQDICVVSDFGRTLLTAILEDKRR